jgi:hypothetical protein
MGLRLNWNGGIMGFERMGQWAIDISHSKMKELSKIIHHSIIPCARQN